MLDRLDAQVAEWVDRDEPVLTGQPRLGVICLPESAARRHHSVGMLRKSKSGDGTGRGVSLHVLWRTDKSTGTGGQNRPTMLLVFKQVMLFGRLSTLQVGAHPEEVCATSVFQPLPLTQVRNREAGSE